MKKIIFSLMMGSALILGACGSDTTESGSGESTKVDGEKIVQQKCISCHGDKLNNGSALDISKVGGKLSQDEIAKVINEGQGAMPKGLITDEKEVEAVAKWLSEQK